METYTAYLPKYGNFSKDVTKLLLAAVFIDVEIVELRATSLDNVYAQLNHGSGQELEGYHGRSLSVGDMIRDPKGKFWMCDSIGWTQFDLENRKLVK